jgi:hypothetical protein
MGLLYRQPIFGMHHLHTGEMPAPDGSHGHQGEEMVSPHRPLEID